MVRLFISGVPQDLSEEELMGRFKPFGTVVSCQIIPWKSMEDGTFDYSKSRGFAYVELEEKDEAALRRCFSTYNGCKWRGARVRVEPAKPSYVQRLQEEWEAEELREAEELERKRKRAEFEAAGSVGDGGAGPGEAPPGGGRKKLKPLRIMQPDGKKAFQALPNKVRNFFPPMRTNIQPSWEPPSTPPAVLQKLQREQEAEKWARDHAPDQAHAAPAPAQPAATAHPHFTAAAPPSGNSAEGGAQIPAWVPTKPLGPALRAPPSGATGHSPQVLASQGSELAAADSSEAAGVHAASAMVQPGRLGIGSGGRGRAGAASMEQRVARDMARDLTRAQAGAEERNMADEAPPAEVVDFLAEEGGSAQVGEARPRGRGVPAAAAIDLDRFASDSE